MIFDKYQPNLWLYFETTMIQKQSMVILVNYEENYDTTTTTTVENSMCFDLSAIQSCLVYRTIGQQKPLIRSAPFFFDFEKIVLLLFGRLIYLFKQGDLKLKERYFRLTHHKDFAKLSLAPAPALLSRLS